MPRRDYRRNERTDLLAAVALIVAAVGLGAIVLVAAFALNGLFL